MPWINEQPDGVTVTVWAVPGASRTEILGIHDGALRVRLATPAEDEKANRELRRLLKAVTGARSVTMLSGGSARKKTLLLANVSAEHARRTLGVGDR